MYPTTRNPRVQFRPQSSLSDFVLLLVLLATVYSIVHTASLFGGLYEQNFAIDLAPQALPGYTAQTLLRMLAAYLLSLGFSIAYAYFAFYSRVAGRVLLPLLDILQSIPVLSFLPGVVLALVALFPGERIGVELAAIVLIFTGMAWNLTFSFYQSLAGIPVELREAATVNRLNLWRRFWTLELPSGVIGLVWNSIMSVAGGWFFLIAIESFALQGQSFRLPGLGSYLAAAAEAGNFSAVGWGLGVLIAVVVLIDQLIWRPLIAWAEKFKFEQVEAAAAPQSAVLELLQRSPTLAYLRQHSWEPLWESLDRKLSRPATPRTLAEPAPVRGWTGRVLLSLSGLALAWILLQALLLLTRLPPAAWTTLALAALLTTLRVTVALTLSLAWTVPAGVAIGRNPRLAQLLQPAAQIAASVPATALFPVLLLALANLGGGLEIGSVALMMLGTMWYLLFNVIAGAQSIPSELFEAAEIYKVRGWLRWRRLILPGIFPYLITGIITAVGGAWNASIVSEYVHFRGETRATLGLGSLISEATAQGNFALLLAATATMSLLVVLTNRLLWRRLYELAQDRYRLL